MRCIIDCRKDQKLDNDYLTMNIWGKPCFSYAVDAVRSSGCFEDIEILTDSEIVIDYCKSNYPNICISSIILPTEDAIFSISGRAPCISSDTIKTAVLKYVGGVLISTKTEACYSFKENCISFYRGKEQHIFNAFYICESIMEERNFYFYQVPDSEAVSVNSANDFELALILKKKQENRPIVIQTIDRIIKDKMDVFQNETDGKSICFIGHSQLDQWPIEEIRGFKVRNCAVSGISSFEYNEKIIKKKLLNCNTNAFLVMHGTNDIVWDYTIDEIVDSIKRNINYLKGGIPLAPPNQ